MTFANAFNVFVTTTTATTARPDPLVMKLRAFGQLATGWSYGRGRQISSAVIDRAERLLELGAQLHLKAEVFPGTDGDIVVAIHQDGTCVQVTVNEDLSLGLRVERGRGPEYEDVIEPLPKATLSNVYTRIIALVKDDNAWKSLESLTSSTTAQSMGVSSIQPSRTQAANKALEILKLDHYHGLNWLELPID